MMKRRTGYRRDNVLKRVSGIWVERETKDQPIF